jgi:proline iminopeptidase
MMEKSVGHLRAADLLYPPVEPFDRRQLDVGDGHEIYVEQCGRPDGIPVVVLHGGPGGGCSPAMRRYFDPARYRIILFDQRGCGRSRPHALVEANTTWHLVRDIELIRQTLGIAQWAVFGGSWGATLGLIYAEEYPERVAHLILRGVFLMTERELDWFYRGGAARFWPEEWERFLKPLPMADRADPIRGYNRILFGSDQTAALQAARHWVGWENALATMQREASRDSPADYARAFARLENHYFTHLGFLDGDTHILDRIDRIARIPGVIVQGRYDMICPPEAAIRLAAAWPAATLATIGDAGHALSEPGITRALVAAMDRLAVPLGKLAG